MKRSTQAILLTCLLLASCSNLYRGIYEGNTSYKDSTKTPMERELKQMPSYTDYQKEKDKLNQTAPATDKDASPEFNLK